MPETRSPIRLRGYIRDSANQPIPDSWLRMTADTTIPDYQTNPKVVITRKPGKIMAGVDGLIDVELINSQDFGTTYLFELGYTEAIMLPPEPPSLVGEMVTRDVVTDSFHAQLPRPIQTNLGNIPVDLADLLPTGIQMNTLDSSIQRLAEVIVSSPVLRAQAMRMIDIKGVYVPTLSYVYGDLVVVAGSPNQTWICISPSFTNPAPLPLNPNLWLRLL